MPDIPTSEPLSLRAGDTWAWKRTLPDYPAGTWTLKYRFKSAQGGFEIIAAASGTDHLVTVAAATSADYPADSWTWMSWVESGAEKHTVGSGATDILPDYRKDVASAAFADLSHARKMLNAIEAWLESRDSAVAEYEIAGRRMKFIPVAELIKLRNHYKNEIAAQANAEAIARGEGGGRKVQFRF